ncbi:unnamed protein product [Meganyctiphanes norvegica]|uniref:Uncharacterized protein n=1 Tax=Meganyctiphanes norvegica TaxID=48144 RepID=A0AAV2SF32_MEGNR
MLKMGIALLILVAGATQAAVNIKLDIFEQRGHKQCIDGVQEIVKGKPGICYNGTLNEDYPYIAFSVAPRERWVDGKWMAICCDQQDHKERLNNTREFHHRDHADMWTDNGEKTCQSFTPDD